VAALARRFARVAIISGRPVQFLIDHFGATGATLSGLYGLESAVAGDEVVEHPGASAWRAAVEQAAAAAEAAHVVTLVERKGLSVTLHFRTEPEAEARARAWVAREAAALGLGVHDGRKSLELRPPIERDKGSVVEELAHGLDAVAFAGDDIGDLPAFDALDRLADHGVATLRVGVRSEEAPLLLLDRADIVVDGPEGTLRWLRELAGL
jgi:trehalose 6-phosphate phosphatase